jgi:hypothetical protein
VVIFGKYVNLHNPAYPYSLYELAYKRPLGISVAVILVLIIDRTLWPNLARVKLRLGLSNVMKEFAMMYGDTASAFLRREIDEKMKKQLVQSQRSILGNLIRCEALFIFAQKEPRLRGPFPADSFRGLLDCMQVILDRFLSARLSIQQGFSEFVRNNIILTIHDERKDLTERVLLLMWILTEALRSHRALPQFLPDIVRAHKKLVERAGISHVFVYKNIKEHSEDFVHFYAYALGKMILFYKIKWL